tara:strand:- start:138 stop:353 length:216 start_codon:yes stop_codon:yes gene_type:complete
MKVSIYFCHSFVSPSSEIYKIDESSGSANVDHSTKTTTENLLQDGWKLSHAIKTSGSAQFDAFNFLLIFEK